MKQTLKKSFLIAALVSAVSAQAAVVPLITPKLGNDAARELIGWQKQINLYDMDKCYGAFSITFEYNQSFKPDRIAQLLFCDALVDCCDCPTINVSGSQVATRGSKDLLADYFGLPTDYQSKLTFKPRVRNFNVDFNLYVGLDEWCEGMYFRIHAPITHTRWDLNFCERDRVAGTNDHDSGYFGSTAITRANLVSSFEDFACNGQTITDAGIDFNSLNCAKISKCESTDTKLAIIEAALGWNFCQDEDYHVGLNIRGAAPTGTKPVGCYLFEPLAGTKNWQLGGGFTSHWTCWRSDDEECDFSIYFDANVTHMFKAKQCRFFDLKCKPLSRYMLAEKLGARNDATDKLWSNAIAATAAASTQPSHQLNGEYTPVANLTKTEVDVSCGVQADLVLKFEWSKDCWAFDVGYNPWIRSCEKICPRCDCNTVIPANTWALKGDSQTVGIGAHNANTVALRDHPVRLSATQSKATVFSGRNTQPGTAYVATDIRNRNVDNPQFGMISLAAAVIPAHVDDQLVLPSGSNAGAAQVSTSNDPIFISSTDVDYDGAQTKAVTHKVFAYLGYTWKDHEDWVPYLGIGGYAEFAQKDDCCCPSSCCDTSCGTSSSSCCTTSCDTSCCDSSSCCCKYAAFNVWGIWVKGGVSFN